MKTRAELYGHEAVGLLRDITMYRVLEKEQLLRLYPGKRGKIENLLSYLTKQGRIFFVDGRYCASLDCAEQMDRGLLAAVWVLIDFIEQVEFHSVSDFPAKIIFFAEGEVYEIIYVEQGKETIAVHHRSCQTLASLRVFLLRSVFPMAFMVLAFVLAFWVC